VQHFGTSQPGSAQCSQGAAQEITIFVVVAIVVVVVVAVAGTAVIVVDSVVFAPMMLDVELAGWHRAQS